MTSGHKTSAIPRVRPRATSGGAGGAAAEVDDDRRRRRLDLTSPIAVERQLVTRRGNRWLLALLSLGVVGALGAALFVLPVQAWLEQRDELDDKRAELAVLTDANRQLQQETDRLQTPEGAKEAARDELGVVDEGEQRLSVLPSAGAPATLPTGWPYDTVTAIIAARTALATAPASSSSIP